MPSPAPSVYLLFGDDDLARGEAVEPMRRKLGDASAADLNFVRFSGTSLDLSELSLACQTLPFLSPRRIIAVEAAQEIARQTGWQDRLTALVSQLPPTTALLLLEDFSFAEVRRRSRRGASPEDLHRDQSPLGKWAEGLGGSVLQKAFERPRGPAWVRWLQDRAARLEGSIDAEAATALAESVEGDPRLADQELAKLLDYVQRERAVTRQDVERLTPFHTQADIFALVDSLGARDSRRALSHFHAVLQDEDPQFALHMIARQVRLLVQARDAIDRRQDVAPAISRLPPTVQSKLRDQASNFRMAELEGLHRGLVQLDLDVKSSRIELTVGLDAFLAEWSRG